MAWKRPDGYIGVKFNGKSTVEHRAVWQSVHGVINNRYLSVHHKNGVKDDNRIDNLELIPLADHSRSHNLKSGKTILMTPEVRAKISAARKATKGKNRKICKVRDCNEFCHAGGYCNRHYIRFRKFGDPAAFHKAARNPETGRLTRVLF